MRQIGTDLNNLLIPAAGESLILDPRQSNLGTKLWGYLVFESFLGPGGILPIPDKATQIKIDIGLSVAAPNSAFWLERLPGRVVFGFEPNPENINELLINDLWKRNPKYHYLNLKYLGRYFFLFNAAIDDCPPTLKTFYMTRDDPGTSSLFSPTDFKIKKKILVPCFRLANFLKFIPWDRFNYIEHIKIDTQGNDLRVLKSAGEYLPKKIVFVTAECTAKGYTYSHTEKELDKFMKEKGFVFLKDTFRGGNKTYLNNRYKRLLKVLDYSTEGR